MILQEMENRAVSNTFECGFEREAEREAERNLERNLESYYENDTYENLGDLARQITTLVQLIPFEATSSFMINTFKSMKHPKVSGRKDIESVLYQILNGGKQKDLILEARATGKPSERYDEIKSILPTFTPNSTFIGSRHGDNVEKLSGILYLDIDGFTEIELKNPLIFATWRSLSNTGRGILVKVKGMTPENIKAVYEGISHELNVQEWVDNSCREISRQNVISYDKNLYVNKESSFYVFLDELKTPNNLTLKRKEERNVESLGENTNNYQIRWDNLMDYDLQDKRYKYFENKESFVKIFIPVIIKEGSRNKTLSALINNFLFLNPGSSEDATHRFILAINERCAKPLNKDEIKRIYKRKYQELESGDLKPFYNFQRSFIFSPEVDNKEKAKLMGQYLGKARSEKSKVLIQECLEFWDLNAGKVTNESIANITGLCVNTVSSHMKTFKHHKDELNRQIKEEKKKNRKKEAKKKL